MTVRSPIHVPTHNHHDNHPIKDADGYTLCPCLKPSPRQAFNIVDPEEMPHMLDLHLFLGRQPTNVYMPPGGVGGGAEGGTTIDGVSTLGKGDAGKDKEGGGGAIVGYDVMDLNPELVHYGNFPQQVILAWKAFEGRESEPGRKLGKRKYRCE